jgi:hypothetical protein
MECTEIKKRLSAYLEKAVSPQQRTLIDEHLKGCRKCRRALADLKKTIRYVQKLEEVEPPPWLVQKVMARVREEVEEKPGILKKLFYPMHIKLPLEAIAVIFIAVGTLYIFKTMQPQMQLAKIPTETKEMARAPVTAPKKEKPPVLEKEKPVPAIVGDQFMYEKRLETREQKSVEKAKAPAAMTPADMARQEEAASAAGAAYRDESGHRGLLSSKAVSPKMAAQGKAKEVRFLITVKDLEIASKDIEETLQLLGGKSIKTEPLGNKAVIAAEIDANKVQELFDKLNLIGEVQEKGMAAETGEGDVGIRIDILKTPTNN